MTLPAFHVYDSTVLLSAEEILGDASTVQALVDVSNVHGGSDPALTAPPRVSVEFCSERQDLEWETPQSFPAVRLDVLSSEDHGGINNGVQNTLHRLQVRSFHTTSSWTQTNAAGKRTIATTAQLRARGEARAIVYGLMQKLIGYTLADGTFSAVFNVLRTPDLVLSTLSPGVGTMIRIVQVLQVWQRTRSGRSNHPAIDNLAYLAALVPARHLWTFAEAAPLADTGTDGTGTLTLTLATRAAPTAPGAQGLLDFTSLSDVVDLTITTAPTQDRAMEWVITMPTETGGINYIAFPPASASVLCGGLRKNNDGTLTFLGGGGFPVEIMADVSVLGAGELLYILAAYDFSESLLTIYTRVEGSAEASTTLALTPSGAATPTAYNFGAYQEGGQTSTHKLHHCATYDTIPSAAHRAAMQGQLGL